jgi:hypothetical protein
MCVDFNPTTIDLYHFNNLVLALSVSMCVHFLKTVLINIKILLVIVL